MKLLYVTPGCFDKGGISRYNRYQITACREILGAGNVKVISLLGPSDDDFEDGFSIDWHGTTANISSKLGLIQNLLKISLTWRPDIILTAHVNLSGIAYLAARLCQAEVVMNAYGLEIWSRLSRDASWGLKKMKLIIADCHNTADWIVKNKVSKVKNPEVIWDCIDLDKFKPEKTNQEILKKYMLPDPGIYFNILSLGRLSMPDATYKGYDRLLEVFSRVALTQERARLVIAGRGNYTQHLRELSKILNIENKVTFTGSVREEDLAAVYNSCHIFSLITESGEGKGEGIPLTPLEAMACGKPILVGNQDGSREAIMENNGYLLDPNDKDGQVRVIMNYLNEAEVLRQHSLNAASVAKKYFSYERFKNEHISYFQKIRSRVRGE